MIALVDYGAGNLTSVRKALAHLGADAWTPTLPGEIGRASAIVVPGVGHFGATRGLTDDWRQAIGAAIRDGLSVLGICVGLQWLFDGSAEAPDVPGLGMFPGRCSRLEPGPDRRLKVPHVGWNALAFPRESRLMHGLAEGTQVYFTHSYAAPVTGDAVATCEHGAVFAAAVERDNVAAVQFHPEKSGDAGLRILGNWLRRR